MRGNGENGLPRLWASRSKVQMSMVLTEGIHLHYDNLCC